MQRRGEAQRGSFPRRVVRAAIDQQIRAGDPIGRNVRQRCAERGEQTRPIGLAIRLCSLHGAYFQPGDTAKAVDQRRARGFRLLLALAEILARAFVDDDRGDGGERFAILAGEGGVCQRQHHQQQRDRAHDGAAAAGEEQQPRHDERNSQAGPYDIGGYQRREGDAEIHVAPIVPAARAARAREPGRPCSFR